MVSVSIAATLLLSTSWPVSCCSDPPRFRILRLAEHLDSDSRLAPMPPLSVVSIEGSCQCMSVEECGTISRYLSRVIWDPLLSTGD